MRRVLVSSTVAVLLAACSGSGGADGVAGPTGPTGPTGATGATGLTGARGAAGADGTTGPQGPTGATGAVGPAGSNGSNGAVGPQGPAGLTWQGAWSATTTYFPSDAVSHLGASWVALTTTFSSTPAEGAEWTLLAEAGAAGIPGPSGPVGLAGADGLPGPQGPAGAVGATGAIGPQGFAGANGLDGATGPMGPQGPAGLNGLDGATGPMGPQGAAGLDGATGPMGPQGPPGDVGAVGPQGPSLAITPWLDGNFDNHILDLTTSSFEPVATVSLPQGSYVVIGKVGLYNLSPGPLTPECWLTQDGVLIDAVMVQLPTGALTALPFQASIVVPAGGATVTISCVSLGLRTYFPHLAAIQVGTLSLLP